MGSQTLEDEINSEDLKLIDAPRELFNPYRILIMKTLAFHSSAEFRELRHALSITDGNLASHLRALEETGYIRCHKEIVGRRVRTTFEITKKGLEAFDDFIDSLRKVVSFE